MSLKLMQGFETTRDDSDFRAQGWVASPSKMQMAFGPSVSGLAGTSMRFLGPGSTNTGANGASGVPDVGAFNTGITVNQAWTAGGFTFGFYAKFNSGTSTNYGAGSTTNPNQACFDGTRYWAMRLIGSSYNVCYSTDLQNWTVAPAQPSLTLNAGTTISHMGSGVVMVCGTGAATTAQVVYYTTNQGSTWLSQTLPNAVGSSSNTGSGIATGNSTYPHMINISTATNGTYGFVFIGTLGGTFTQVASVAVGAATTTFSRIRNIGGVLICYDSGSIFSATASSGSLNTAGAWSTCVSSAQSIYTDIAYHPTSNLWVMTSSTGIWTLPNAGAAGTPTPLTGTQTATQRYSTVGMSSIYLVGSTLVAVGQQGHIVTSPDGINWTESGGHILPVGTSGWDWRSAIYDGTQYVLFSDATTGVIATTSDLQNNYAAKYVQDGTEQTAFTNGNGHTGIYAGTAPNASTGLWTPAANFFAFAVGALSAGVRAVHAVNASSGTEASFNIANANTVLGHYYEIVCTAAATANNFTHQIWIDGSLAYTSGSTAYLMGSSTSDTTSLLILTLDRFATMTAYDDMYFLLNDGINLSGPQGVINIVVQRGESDTQAQWVKNGTAASNSLSVNQPALSSQSANYVSSSNAGDKDIYTTTDTLPAGYTPKAVQNEAYFTKTSTTAPVVNVGSISGSTESDSANATISGTGATYVSQILEKDPNGNVAWSASSVNALKFALNHVS